MKKFLRLAAVAALAGFTAFAGTTAAQASVRPVPTSCSKLVIFNFPHGTSVITETQGPWLKVNEVAAYQGQTFTITSVTHTGFLGHDRFTVKDIYGSTVVNSGPSIFHGEAHLVSCGLRF